MNYMEEQWREKGRPAQGRAQSGGELESERKNPVLSTFRSKGASKCKTVGTASSCRGLGGKGLSLVVADKMYLLLRLKAVGHGSACKTQRPRKDSVIRMSQEPGLERRLVPLSPLSPSRF